MIQGLFFRGRIISDLIVYNSKLADWDDDDPSALPDTSSRLQKVVVLKHMFTLDEIEVRIEKQKLR